MSAVALVPDVTGVDMDTVKRDVLARYRIERDGLLPFWAMREVGDQYARRYLSGVEMGLLPENDSQLEDFAAWKLARAYRDSIEGRPSYWYREQPGHQYRERGH